MKVLISDTEIDIKAEGEKVLALVWEGDYLHIRLARGEPYKSPRSSKDSGTASPVHISGFTGVTPELEAA